MKAYVTTRDRELALRVCLPRIVESCHNAGLTVTVYDDGTQSEEVRAFIAEHADEAVFRPRPVGMRNGMIAEAETVMAEFPQADYWLHIDADVYLAPESVSLMLEAAEALGPSKASVLAFLAIAKIPAGRDITVGKWSYRPRALQPRGPWEKLSIFDPARIMYAEAFKRGGGPRAIVDGCKALAARSKLPMYLVRPQIPCQHLGLGVASGQWHNWRTAKSPWVRKLAIDADTGQPVEVDGLDVKLWHAAAMAGEEDLRAFVETGRLSVDARKNIPPTVAYVGSQADASPYIVSAVETGERLLLVWTGRIWQGDRTRRALGIPEDAPHIRACPAGYKHPWLSE